MFDMLVTGGASSSDRLLETLQDLAVQLTGACSASIELYDRAAPQRSPLRTGLAEGTRQYPLTIDDRLVGALTLGGLAGSLTPAQAVMLAQLRPTMALAGEQELELRALRAVSSRARRADVLLHLVSEAVSCADALTGLLGELCRHHGAMVGRIWLLGSDDLLHEVSRFNTDVGAAHSYYRHDSRAVHAGNSMTASAIMEDTPRTAIYSQVTNKERFVLLRSAIEAGLASQVSFPMMVQEERFGISLAFTTERTDLDSIVADIGSLSDTIRPLLFRKVTEERIRFMALHDDLTKLANRTMFNDRLRAAVARAELNQTGLSILYLDLDGFKLVNDLRGHAAGDRLLAEVARRLRDSVREGDVVARIGGDEFAIIQDGDGAERLAERLIELVRQPADVGGQLTSVGVSIGIADYPVGGRTPDDLLRNADTALYAAKNAGRNTLRMFDASMGADQRERDIVERDLRRAIEDETLTLAYQPIVEVRSGRLRGKEALLRWTHPKLGAIAPEVFVPIAEASGLIVQLGAWVLEHACAEAVRWPEEVCLSVNFSPLQFRQANLPEQLVAVLQRTGLAPKRLNLEITEGLLLDASEAVLSTMKAVRALGIRMTLDDFGTAYASLSYLRLFPFDRIKVDQSFIRGMAGDYTTVAIVEAVLSLSARLGVEVVAEGVETEEQMRALERLGCELVQGFLTGRPAGVDDHPR